MVLRGEVWLSNVIHVNPNTLDERDYDSVRDMLEFYGYEFEVSDNLVGTNSYAYIMDARSPEWRGWRSALSAIDWRHYDKTVEYNRQKVLDSKPKVCYTEEDDGCTS